MWRVMLDNQAEVFGEMIHQFIHVIYNTVSHALLVGYLLQDKSKGQLPSTLVLDNGGVLLCFNGSR